VKNIIIKNDTCGMWDSLNPSSISIPIALVFFSYILNDFWGGFSFGPNSNILLALLLVYYSAPDLSCGDHQKEVL
jgi:hypothetical protein